MTIKSPCPDGMRLAINKYPIKCHWVISAMEKNITSRFLSIKEENLKVSLCKWRGNLPFVVQAPIGQ